MKNKVTQLSKRQRRFFLKAHAYLLIQSENYAWMYAERKGKKLSRKAKKQLDLAKWSIDEANRIIEEVIDEIREEEKLN